MSLRLKTEVILISVIGVYAALLYAFQREVVGARLVALERGRAIDDLRRVVAALEDETLELERLCLAWPEAAIGNAQGEARTFVTTLTPSAAKKDRLDLICRLSHDGRILSRTSLDHTTGEPITIDIFAGDALPPGYEKLVESGANKAVSGILMTSLGPLVVAARPLVRQDAADTAPGPASLFVIGRLLDTNLIRNIATRARLAVHLYPLDAVALAPDERDALGRISEVNRYVTREAEENILRVYTTLLDVYGVPAVLLRADVPRDITAAGAGAFRVARRASLVAGAVALLLAVVLLSHTVIGPLARLSRHVAAIGKTGELSVHLPMARKDEIGALARDFNTMVRRLQRDMAERQRAETALRSSEARVRAILQSAPDGMITLDDKGLVESFNPAAESIFGYGAEEMVGQSIRGLVPELEQGDVDVCAWLLEEHSDGPAAGEVVGVRKDGATFPMHVTASEVPLGDRRIFIMIVRDITELKQMHERVLQSEHLAMIGEMGASMAHEIRNPLAGISGAIQVLRDSLDVADERRDITGEILEQVLRVEDTIRALLMFTKSLAPQKTSCNLKACVERVTSQALKQPLARDIRLSFEGDADITAPLDETLFAQVIWNVLNNAVQAMPDGGEIRCAFYETPEKAVVEIADTGPGVAPQVRDTVFRPFITTRAQGTGLGLAVCRKIIEAHEGKIAIGVGPNGGTRVTVALPKGG